MLFTEAVPNVANFANAFCSFVEQTCDGGLIELASFCRDISAYVWSHRTRLGDELAARGVGASLCGVMDYMAGAPDQTAGAAYQLYLVLYALTCQDCSLLASLCEWGVPGAAFHHLHALQGADGEVCKDGARGDGIFPQCVRANIVLLRGTIVCYVS